MTESNEISPRPRWFQFDLKLLFVIVTALGVILALEMARRSDAEKAQGLASMIRVGEQVVLSLDQHGFEITRQQGAHSHTVLEVGKDYVRLESIDGPVSVIPLEKIYRIVDDPRPNGPYGGGQGGGFFNVPSPAVRGALPTEDLGIDVEPSWTETIEALTAKASQTTDRGGEP